MFLILNTSVRNNTSFNCASRTHFCKLSSSELNIEDFQGRLVFNLDLINGSNDNSKIKHILKLVKIDWETEKPVKSSLVSIGDIVAEQKEYLAEVVSKNQNILNKSFINDKVVELRTIEPFSSLFESPRFNSLGYYSVSERFI